MSTKRKYSEEEEAVHPSRKSQFSTSQNGSPKKPRKFESPAAMHKKQAQSSSVNLIKKKIRDVTRRLERSEDLPADVKAEDERALDAYKQELEAAENEKVRQKMIKRYHMVRFFERQKATRRVKKLRKALIEATNDGEVAQLTKDLHIADVDLHYTQYSPLNEVYVGIYHKDASAEEHNDASKRPEMWYEVEKRMEQGGLDELRNGIRMTLVSRPKPQPKISGANGEAQTKVRVMGQQSAGNKNASSAKGKNPRVDESKPQRMSKYMTDEEFFKLNRREKRKELKRSGTLATTSSAPSQSNIGGGEVMDTGVDDGGFFEE